MKQLFLLAVLAMIGLSAKAQHLHNSTSCDVEFRPFCLNVTTCAITYPGTGAWTYAPWGPTLLPGGSCGAGTILGYEVRYAVNTGCSGNAPAMVIDLQGLPTPPPCPVSGIATMGACPNCTSSPNGLSVDFYGGVMHVNP